MSRVRWKEKYRFGVEDETVGFEKTSSVTGSGDTFGGQAEIRRNNAKQRSPNALLEHVKSFN